jgi:hypothetical protein
MIVETLCNYSLLEKKTTGVGGGVCGLVVVVVTRSIRTRTYIVPVQKREDILFFQ